VKATFLKENKGIAGLSAGRSRGRNIRSLFSASILGLCVASLGTHAPPRAFISSASYVCPEPKRMQGILDKTQSAPDRGLMFTPLAIIDFFDPSDDMPASGTGQDNSPTHIWFHGSSFRASDGKSLIAASTNFSTLALASRYLDRKLKTVKIIERKPRTDEKGQAVGERIVALLPLPTQPGKNGSIEPQKMIPAVIRTSGTVCNLISASSLDEVPAPVEDVLALEKYLGSSH